MLIGFGIYLAVHFALFTFILRHRESFRTERVIFLYHAIPATVVGVLTLVRAAVAEGASVAIAEAVLVLALQGIYSLSFLEMWSLAQGGYSLRILAEYESARAGKLSPDTRSLENIGRGKLAERLAGLRRLRFVDGGEGRVALTRTGKGVAALLRVFVVLANVKDPG